MKYYQDKCICGNIKSKSAKQCQKCYLKNNVGKNSPRYIDGRTNKQYYCKDCGKEISNHSGKIRFDNHRCKSCAKQGNRSPFYINGKSNIKYPTEFSYQLKQQIRKRDKYKCQNCGIRQVRHVKKWHKILEVHHIDHNRENNKKTNLITLCHKCNTQANFNIRYWVIFYTKLIKRILV